MNRATSKPPARFSVSLHPEIFYALQVLSDSLSRTHAPWRVWSLERFPLECWPIHLPSALWTAVPDVLQIGPVADLDALVSALEEVPDRTFQVRFLIGLLHHQRAALALLDENLPVERIAASVPKVKREWLAHVGLYPIKPDVEDALGRLLRSPQSFRAGVVETVRAFWEAAFADTWEELLPALSASLEEKQRLFEQCSFKEFLRHTLLPIELVESRMVLRALRGGYELPLAQIKECTLTPSVFNDRRFWTTHSEGDLQSPWFPYCEPGLEPHSESPRPDGVEPVPDVALIFRALGDATRFAMISLIARCPRSAAELASLLAVSKPTVSHHLHVLRSAGLVHETDHGSSVLISINKEILCQLSDLATARLLESRKPLRLTRSRRTP